MTWGEIIRNCAGSMLLAVTEVRTRDEIEQLAEALEGLL